MKNLLFILFAFPFLFVSCSNDDNYFPEDREYRLLLFNSIEECRSYQETSFVNCYQTVSFNKDGSAVYMVTDIMLRATYKVDGNKITLRMHEDDVYETDRVVHFTIIDDDHIIRQGEEKAWERVIYLY